MILNWINMKLRYFDHFNQDFTPTVQQVGLSQGHF